MLKWQRKGWQHTGHTGRAKHLGGSCKGSCCRLRPPALTIPQVQLLCTFPCAKSGVPPLLGATARVQGGQEGGNINDRSLRGRTRRKATWDTEMRPGMVCNNHEPSQRVSFYDFATSAQYHLTPSYLSLLFAAQGNCTCSCRLPTHALKATIMRISQNCDPLLLACKCLRPLDASKCVNLLCQEGSSNCNVFCCCCT